MKLKTQQQKPQKVVQVEMWYEIHVIKKKKKTQTLLLAFACGLQGFAKDTHS